MALLFKKVLVVNNCLVSLTLYDNDIRDTEIFLNLLFSLQETGNENNNEHMSDISMLCVFQNICELVDDSRISNLKYREGVKKTEQKLLSKLQHFDLSKNKCDLLINAMLIKILKNIKLGMLDISQNIGGRECNLKDKLVDMLKSRDKAFKIIY
jgi:hypothetical protein